jgi:predicted acetyltransferase
VSIDSATDLEIRPVSRQEFPEFFRSIVETFGEDVRDSDREMDAAVFEPERSLAVIDSGRIVGTAAAYSRQLTVPGAVLPFAGVTMVSVAPTHRRRGLLTSMMRRQLTELFEEQREPVAALWASEAAIYGRFGYGLAARSAHLSGRAQPMRPRPDVDLGRGRARMVSLEELRVLAPPVHDQVRRRTVGWLDRAGRWWDYRLYDPEHLREGCSALRAVVHEEPDGTPTGYARYRIKVEWTAGQPNNELQVFEVTALTPAAYAATWSFLLNLDLVRRVRAQAALDEPLQHLAVDARAVELAVRDNVWVRVVDVGRALAARRYARDVDVVLDVTDTFCPWNAGRWRLRGGPEGAECVRTTDEADLALGSTDLGAAYLGGTSLAVLAAAGRVTELRQGALGTAAAAFGHDREPYCPEVF